MKPLEFLDECGLTLASELRLAFIKTLETWSPSLGHLPVAMRFRASGALQAWLDVFDALPSTANARRVISDPAVAPQSARFELMMALEPHITGPTGEHAAAVSMVNEWLASSCNMLVFWLRSNTMYEPTLRLSSLLGDTDMAPDLPMRWLQPPVHTLCIVPPWQQRYRCANASDIMVFSHDATRAQAPALRTLTLLAMRPQGDGVTADELILPVRDEGASLAATLARVTNASRRDSFAIGIEGNGTAQTQIDWKLVLDYTAKVFLYLHPSQNGARRRVEIYPKAPKESFSMEQH